MHHWKDFNIKMCEGSVIFIDNGSFPYLSFHIFAYLKFIIGIKFIKLFEYFVNFSCVT